MRERPTPPPMEQAQAPAEGWRAPKKASPTDTFIHEVRRRIGGGEVPKDVLMEEAGQLLIKSGVEYMLAMHRMAGKINKLSKLSQFAIIFGTSTGLTGLTIAESMLEARMAETQMVDTEAQEGEESPFEERAREVLRSMPPGAAKALAVGAFMGKAQPPSDTPPQVLDHIASQVRGRATFAVEDTYRLLQVVRSGLQLAPNASLEDVDSYVEELRQAVENYTHSVRGISEKEQEQLDDVLVQNIGDL